MFFVYRVSLFSGGLALHGTLHRLIEGGFGSLLILAVDLALNSVSLKLEDLFLHGIQQQA